MPTFVGDSDDRLTKVSSNAVPMTLSLWVLTHPDLKGTARVRALMDHLYKEMGDLEPLFTGTGKLVANELLP